MTGERLDLFALQNLTFERPDRETFRGLYLAEQALREGGNRPAVFNAANECAVALFLNREISFLQITELIEGAMGQVAFEPDPDVDAIFEAQAAAEEWIKGRL